MRNLLLRSALLRCWARGPPPPALTPGRFFGAASAAGGGGESENGSARPSYYYERMNGHLKEIGLYSPPRENRKAPRPRGEQRRRRTEELSPDGRRILKVQQKEIRVSPWQLNLLARQIRGLPVVDATANMMFSKKKHASTIMDVLRKVCNLADMRHGLKPEQLQLHQCYVTRGKVRKSIRIMGRGRHGIARRKWSHLNIHVAEIPGMEMPDDERVGQIIDIPPSSREEKAGA